MNWRLLLIALLVVAVGAALTVLDEPKDSALPWLKGKR